MHVGRHWEKALCRKPPWVYLARRHARRSDGPKGREALLKYVLRQPIARDEPNQIWLFGPRPEARMKVLQSLEAPDFTLPDLDGRMHSLSQQRGKKVLLVAYASW